MKFDNVIFDFDGTLADTSPGVLGSVRYALETLGAPVPDEKVLRGFIGPSLYSSFTGIIGFDGKKADEIIFTLSEIDRVAKDAGGVIGEAINAAMGATRENSCARADKVI